MFVSRKEVCVAEVFGLVLADEGDSVDNDTARSKALTSAQSRGDAAESGITNEKASRPGVGGINVGLQASVRRRTKDTACCLDNAKRVGVCLEPATD